VFGLAQIATTYDLRNNWVYGFETDVLNGANNNALASPPTVTNAGTTDPRPYLNADFVPKVSGGTTFATLAADNPLAVAGVYIRGVQLKNGRMRPGHCPVGAYQAVLPRTERTFADRRDTTAALITQDQLNLLTEDGELIVVE
jgi:hypothetical protein